MTRSKFNSKIWETMRRSSVGRTLVFGIFLSIIAAAVVHDRLQYEQETRFKNVVAEISENITRRLERYQNALIQTRAYLMASRSISRDEFHLYIEGAEIMTRYPGIQGIGYAVRLRPEEVNHHVTEQRAKGFPSYRIWPEYPREEYFSIVYLEPMDWRNQRAIGYDMYTEPTRQEAMNRAWDNDEVVLSGKVKLVQENGEKIQPGFLMYLPYYGRTLPDDASLKQRHAALKGFVYAAFRAHDFISGIIGSRAPAIDFEIYDGEALDESTLLYDRDGIPASHWERSAESFRQQLRVSFAGRNWTLVVRTLPGFERTTLRHAPWLVLLLGLVITTLLIIVSRSTRGRMKAERTMETILSSAADGIFGLNLAGETTFVNPAACKMLGWQHEELMGRVQHEFVHHSHPDGSPYPKQDCPIYSTFTDGEVHERDDEYFWRKDGSSFPVEYRSSPLVQDGKLSGAVVTFKDITSRKNTEQELRDAIRARDEFISICSHELKTPVTSMKLQFQMAARHLAQGNPAAYSHDTVSKRIEVTNRQLNRMSSLIEDMLDVSRINAGRLELQLASIDLSALVSEVLANFEGQLVAAGCALDSHIAPSVIVTGDSFRIEQVISNLLTNAIKYAPGKTVKVVLEEKEGMARLIVEDSGPGIATESLRRIFERFQRVESNSGISGLGLGLYISRKIIEAHGGRIWCESEPGKGAAFFIELGLG